MRFGKLFPACLLLLSCGKNYPPCEKTPRVPVGSVPLSAPAAGVKVQDERIVVYPEPGSDWRSLICLDLFVGFRPGMRAEEARKKFGTPKRHIEDTLESLWIYDRPKGDVIIAHSEQGSLPFLPRVWFLYGRPYNPSPAELFHPVLLPYMRASKSELEVTIINNCGYPGASAEIESGKVVKITWLDNTGSGGIGDQRQESELKVYNNLNRLKAKAEDLSP